MPPRQTSATPSPQKAAPRNAAGLTPRRVADRLHKTVCQSITGARFLLKVIEQQLPQDAAELKKQVREVDTILRDSGLDLHLLLKELRSGAKSSRQGGNDQS